MTVDSPFTPMPHEIAKAYNDPIIALVYGAVWAYSQMAQQVCNASVDTIAERISVSRKTAERKLKALCKDGYLIDLTPDVTHAPHTYICSNKVSISVSKHDGSYYTQGKSESLTSDDKVGQRVLPRSDSESSLGRSESLIKKQLQDTTKETTNSGGGFVADLPEIINAMDERGYAPLSNEQLRAIYDALAVPANETPLMWISYALDRNQQIGDKSLDCLTVVLESINTVGSLATFKQSDKPTKQGEHPAIEAYKAATGYYPRRNCQSDIISKIGDDSASVAKWGEVVKAWKLAGYKFDNYQGMFDWFETGIPTRKERNYASNKSGIIGLQEQSTKPIAPKLVFDPATGQTYAQ